MLVDIKEAEVVLDSLVDIALQGIEVVITVGGNPVAQLEPLPSATAPSPAADPAT